MKYKVKFYQGDYSTRQKNANADKAICYLEQHFNSGSEKATYALANVATNAGATSKKWASDYVGQVSATFGTKPANNDFAKDGVSVGGYKGRGNGNLLYTAMPAILCEPLFATNPEQAAIIRSTTGQDSLAKCIALSIAAMFPNGGLVAFSVGHKGRHSKPHDLGVPLVNRPANLRERDDAEAVYAEIVLKKAAALLEAM